MAEGTGTSVGVITLDLRIVSKLNEQLNSIAANANRSAQQSFQQVGKTVQESISKPMENAGKTMEKAITAPIERASAAVKAPLKAVTDQVEQTADEIEAIAARANKRLHDSITNPDGRGLLPTTAKLHGHSALETDPTEFMNNWDDATLKPKVQETPSVTASASGAAQTSQVASSAFTRMAARIQSAFASVNQSVKKTFSDITSGAQSTAAKTIKSAQDSVKAVESAERKKRSATMGTLRTQTNAMISAVTSNAQGIAKVGVLGRAMSSSLTGSLSVAAPLALAAAAFATLRKAFSLATVNSDQFKKSLNEVKANLEIAFTPIYQAILPALNSLMAWLAAATKQVAAFISALFGKTYAQSLAATKQMQKNAADAEKKKSGSGSKDKGQLASFDELKVISQKGGAAGTDAIDYDALNTKGTEAATSLAEKFKSVWAGIAAGFNDYVTKPIQDNLSKFDAPVARFKALFAGIGEQCREWMTPLSNWFQTDFKSALAQGISDGSTMLSGFMDSLAMVAETVWATLQPAINWIIRNGLPILTDAFKEVSKTTVVAFDAVKTVFDTLWHGVIDPFAQFVSKVIVDILNTFKSLWEQYGVTTFENIRTMINSVRDTFLNVWNSFLKPVFDQIFSVLDQLWTDHLLPLIGQIGEFVMKLVNGAMEIYNGFIAPLVNWFVTTLGPPIAEVLKWVIKNIGDTVGAILDAAANIFKALGGVIDFLVGVFTGDWGKAWKGIQEIFSGVFGALYDIAKTPLNAIIGLLEGFSNAFIDGVNGIIETLNKIRIPDDFPIKKWAGVGIHIEPKAHISIPRLANGGVLEQPTLAMMGEYAGARSNPEIATPQSLMMDTFMETLVPLLNELEEFREDMVQLLREIIAKNPNIILDGAMIARLLKPYFDEEDKRVGGTIF
ncbi:phage tail protein [Caproiciproducens sp.]